MSATVDILDRLIAFPTVSAASNLDLIAWVEAFLAARGFSTHRVPDETGQKAGLFATIGPTDRPGILLSAHSDVVPVEGQDWSRDPFRLGRAGGRLYGRGTTDMKGYLAAMLACADRAARMALREPLKLAISYDEEIGCVGIRNMIGALEPGIGLPRLCFVGEPTEMQIAIGHKGKTALRAICHGEAGHSALAPRFLNAVHLAADFVRGLREMQDDLAAGGARDPDYEVPYSTVHVGRIEGGRALNIVPDRAEIGLEIRHVAGDDAGALQARVRAIAETVAAEYRGAFPAARIDVEEVNSYPGLAADPDGDAAGLARDLLPEARLTKVAFGTEAGYFAGLGIPTVVCGPGSMTAQGHKPDESIGEAELAAADRFANRLLQEMRLR